MAEPDAERDATVPASKYDRSPARPGELAFTRAAASMYALEHGAIEVQSTATAHALRMDVPFLVMTHEGVMSGDAGDYLLTRGGDDAWPVKAAIFEDTYRPA